MLGNFTDISSLLGLPVWLIVIVSAWSLIWKGLALWKSARLRQPVWFIALLVINTIGILEILYLFLFSKIKFDKNKKEKPDSKTKNKKRR